MARGIRLADLPTTQAIDPQSYVIIEKPGIDDGTFKSTVGDLQEAITVHATVTRSGQDITIDIQDINGETSETITNPTAAVTRSGQDVTIDLTDESGATSETITIPTAGVSRSSNTITVTLSDENGQTTQSFVVPTSSVTKSGHTITITINDDQGTSTQSFIEPTVSAVDNADGTTTITCTDADGTTTSTFLSHPQFDSQPTQGSNNLISSGTLYTILQSVYSRLGALEAEAAVALITTDPAQNS